MANVENRLRELDETGHPYYFGWVRHARYNAAYYEFESSTLWAIEQQIRWRMIEDRHRWFFRGKRAFDLILCMVMLPLVLPIILVIAAAVKASNPSSPVFFTQLRFGRNGRPFWMWKFRTADPRAGRVNHFIPTTKITVATQTPARLPQLLRRSSLDELPQVFNVLKGDMSLVGPRPLPADDTLFVKEAMYRRFAVPPGITGLWQGQVPIVTDGWHKLHYDCLYVDRLGWRQDLTILLSTFKVLIYKPFAKELWA